MERRNPHGYYLAQGATARFFWLVSLACEMHTLLMDIRENTRPQVSNEPEKPKPKTLQQMSVLPDVKMGLKK